MLNFKSYSIKKKLIVMQVLTSLVVLIISFAIFAAYNFKVLTKYVMDDLVSTATLISSNSISALTFLDKAAANEVLTTLQVEENITNAWIHDRHGNLFGSYSKKGHENRPFPGIDSSHIKVQGCFITHNTKMIIISKEIIDEGESVGMLSLRLTLQQFEKMFFQGAFVLIIILFICLVIALLLSYITQKKISLPILKLADAGQKVIDTGDYSIRVEKEGEDEIGTLYDSFNNLMDQVHVRENERDKAYFSVRESEQKYRALFDNMNDGFAYHKAVYNAEGLPVDYIFLEVNEAFEKYTGLKSKEIIGKKVTAIIPEIEKLSPGLISKYGLVALTGESSNFELFFEPFKKWYSVSAYSPEKNYFCTVFKDITAAKKSEELEKEHQQKLIQTDKMTTLGILVSGVAHEINNPNNYMLLNSNNLADIWKDLTPLLDKYVEEKGDFMLCGLPYSEMKPEISPLISSISEGSERIRKIVDNLKDYARKDPGKLNENVNIVSVIEASSTILSNLIKKSTYNFEVSCDADLPLVKGNFQQLEQVIINLLSNSCQAFENQNQKLSIKASSSNNNIVIVVEDTGKGIFEEDMTHIMDPFFTTKRDSGGTGLGLSICYTIIKDHGGDLKIESEIGKGTKITLTLPIK